MYSSDLEYGSYEIPCVLHFMAINSDESRKAKNLHIVYISYYVKVSRFLHLVADVYKYNWIQ